MKKLTASFSIRFALLASIVAGAAAPAQAIPFAHGLSVFTAAIERAKAPNGWSAFCARYASECSKTSYARKIALTAMASAEPVADWNGASNKAILTLPESPLAIIWAIGGQEAEQPSVKLAYWDASIDAHTLFVPKAEKSFLETKQET